MTKNKTNHTSNLPNPRQEKIFTWFSSTWGMVISACTLIGIGVGVGTYFQQIRGDIEKTKELMQVHLQQEETNRQYDMQIHDLHQQIYQLESEVLKLKGEHNNEPK